MAITPENLQVAKTTITFPRFDSGQRPTIDFYQEADNGESVTTTVELDARMAANCATVLLALVDRYQDEITADLEKADLA